MSTSPETENKTQILDGKATSAKILEECAARVADIKKQTDVTPCLATVLVGNDPASVTYTGMKRKRCEGIGMRSVKVELDESISTEQLVAEITRLGEDKDVHGILLQHPVPHHIDERAAFEAIPPLKDVDGVTIHSFGTTSFGLPGYGSCTPAGMMRLMQAYDLPFEGKHAVVVGRSPILGKPMAMMLLQANATVSICHSRTPNVPEIVKQADIVVAAVGKARFIHGDWIKQGAVVMDAGYSQDETGKLAGDVDYDSAYPKASWITPVPGGVGPMTIATLIEQTVYGAERQLGLVVE